jgi:hypothetical protein
MNILTKFGSNCPSGLREEDEKQTKPFYTPLELLFLLCTSNQQIIKKILEDHPMNIPTRFGSNCPSGLREDVKQKTTFLTHFCLLFPIVYFRLANKTYTL